MHALGKRVPTARPPSFRFATLQQAVRAFANLNGYNPTDTVPTLSAELFGEGKFIREDPTTGGHPASGVAYVIAAPTVIPNMGVLYMTANDPEYVPNSTENW